MKTSYQDLDFPPLDLEVPTEPAGLEGSENLSPTVNELKWTINAQYPHIAKQIEVFWGEPEMVLKFRDWMVDNRGGSRKGFSKETMNAIVLLDQIHNKTFAFDDRPSWLGDFKESEWSDNALYK